MLSASVVAGLALCSCALFVDPSARPSILDWHVRDAPLPGLPIVPAPHPGWDLPASSNTYATLYANQFAADEPVGLMLRDGTAPLFGWKDPEALATTLTMVPRLDFVFADFEILAPELAVLGMIDLVRGNLDPAINLAWIGAYNEYPGPYDDSFANPALAFRSFQSNFYLTVGLDVAMPACYPYSVYQAHTSVAVWGEYVAPNIRSALFWAPIHRATIAKLNLPSTHMLIPWVNPYVSTAGYPNVTPPTAADRVALVQHLRLRGCDGYYVLESPFEDYPTAQYRLDMLNAWQSLDFIFDVPANVTTSVMNLSTDKVSGVQWSGVSRPGFAAVLVSNLGNAAAQVTLPGSLWPDGGVVTVAAGTHQLFVAESGGPVADLDGDGVVDAFDLGALLSAWGVCPPRECPADLNGDGKVDAADLGMLLASWTS